MTDLDLTRYDAVLFDLDGVLTDTASLHATAWKRMFDEFLQRWSEEHGHPFVPFTIDVDYLQYVDGKPRIEGVASFLESRRIVLPEGEPTDAPDADSIHGLGDTWVGLPNTLSLSAAKGEGCAADRVQGVGVGGCRQVDPSSA